jgi:Uma2 family endonuclease
MHRPATKADLDALPRNMRGEIIDGVLYTQAFPRARHQNLIGSVGSDVRGPYQRGRGGPGGWWILLEPGIELPGSPEVSPDVAGWRKERLPKLPANESIRIAPDWACEVLSPATRSYDLRIKKPFYARVGVKHLWYIDLEARVLTVSRLHEGMWLELGVYGEDAVVRVEPFVEVEIALADWWA